MEYYTTELVLSVPAAIQLAKATANTLESPPRLYDGDVSSVHLWTDNPGRVKHRRNGEESGAYTIWQNIDFFILTLKVEPSIIELPICWHKKLKGWLTGEKPQPEIHFDGYYVNFVHNYWSEYLPRMEFQARGLGDKYENMEILLPEERKDQELERRIQEIVEHLEQINDEKIEELYKKKKDTLEKELKSRREDRAHLAHYWRFQVKPDKTVDFVGETGPNLPKNPALSLPKC